MGFMDLILQPRGSNNATVKDIVDLRKSVLGQLHTRLDSIEEAQQTCVDYMVSAVGVSKQDQRIPLKVRWEDSGRKASDLKSKLTIFQGEAGSDSLSVLEPSHHGGRSTHNAFSDPVTPLGAKSSRPLS